MANYGENFQKGLEFQDFCVQQLWKAGICCCQFSSKKSQYDEGESLNGIEIKLDEGATKYGRLSIEIAEKTKAENEQWIPSGIYRCDNSWLYCQGSREVIYIFAKSTLLNLAKLDKWERGESFGTIRKFYLPLEVAEKWAAKVIRVKGE